MKIVFLLPGTEGRPKILNGNTIVSGGAPSSGTDQSIIMISEYLASNGYDVTIVLDKTDKQECNSVKYIDFTYEGINETDILVSCLWFDKYDLIPFKVTTGLIYWYHMAWVYGINEMINFSLKNNIKMGFVNISEWSAKQNDWSVSMGISKVEGSVKKIIPNPIMTELMDSISPIERKENSTIFHAQYGRGGDIARRVVNELGWDETFLFDYINPGNGTDKLTLFNKLLESDYFIFPLYHPNGCVYKDTFSCSVAEAIAAGVIVVTYPLGAIPEYFSDGCVFVDFPPDADMVKMMTEHVTCNAEYMNRTENIIKKIKHLEEHKELKEEIRIKSKDLIKHNFSINIVGKKWIELINELTYE